MNVVILGEAVGATIGAVAIHTFVGFMAKKMGAKSILPRIWLPAIFSVALCSIVYAYGSGNGEKVDFSQGFWLYLPGNLLALFAFWLKWRGLTENAGIQSPPKSISKIALPILAVTTVVITYFILSAHYINAQRPDTASIANQLREMVKIESKELPLILDENTILNNVLLDGYEVMYYYTVNLAPQSLKLRVDAIKQNVLEQGCANPNSAIHLSKDVTFTFFYDPKTNDKDIQVISINAGDCP